MKKIIFLMGMVMFYLISCQGDKGDKSVTKETDYSKFDTMRIPDTLAVKMIDSFRVHKHTYLKEEIKNASAKFDRGLLSTLAGDSNVKSMTFFLAAFVKIKVQGVDNDTNLIPTILIRVKMKDTSNFMSKIPVYYRPIGICPPPNGDCKVQ